MNKTNRTVCYEAGPFGYSLHRKLTALGVTNFVVRPRDWDKYGHFNVPGGESFRFFWRKRCGNKNAITCWNYLYLAQQIGEEVDQSNPADFQFGRG